MVDPNELVLEPRTLYKGASAFAIIYGRNIMTIREWRFRIRNMCIRILYYNNIVRVDFRRSNLLFLMIIKVERSTGVEQFNLVGSEIFESNSALGFFDTSDVYQFSSGIDSDSTVFYHISMISYYVCKTQFFSYFFPFHSHGTRSVIT